MEGDSLQCLRTHPEKRRAIRIARLGRKLPGEREWVELSDSLIKAKAKIEPGHKIVLRYYGKHGLVGNDL